MAIQTVGLLSPGEMGHTIGGVLHANGVRVLTHLGGRSERSKALAAQAGMEDTSSLDELVSEAEILLSVLVPAQATTLAGQVAMAIERTGASLLYVDCNAIAPATVEQIGARVLAAGGRFCDAGIVGPPPRKPGTTRFYASGSGATGFAELSTAGLDVRVIGDRIGQASGLKMCYAALTKGLIALGTELLVAAHLMGLDDALRDEQRESIPSVLSWMEDMLPGMPPKAYRWVGEMEEIAATFEALGMTSRMLEGAADMYRFVEKTSLGQETPETRDTSRDAYDVVIALASDLEKTHD